MRQGRSDAADPKGSGCSQAHKGIHVGAVLEQGRGAADQDLPSRAWVWTVKSVFG